MSRRSWVYWMDPETGEARSCERSQYVDPGHGRLELMTGSMYDGLKATDGTDIGSRAKYEAYKRAHGLTHSSDYSADTLRKLREGPPPEQRQREIKQDLARSWAELESRGKRGRY